MANDASSMEIKITATDEASPKIDAVNKKLAVDAPAAATKMNLSSESMAKGLNQFGRMANQSSSLILALGGNIDSTAARGIGMAGMVASLLPAMGPLGFAISAVAGAVAYMGVELYGLYTGPGKGMAAWAAKFEEDMAKLEQKARDWRIENEKLKMSLDGISGKQADVKMLQEQLATYRWMETEAVHQGDMIGAVRMHDEATRLQVVVDSLKKEADANAALEATKTKRAKAGTRSQGMTKDDSIGLDIDAWLEDQERIAAAQHQGELEMFMENEGEMAAARMKAADDEQKAMEAAIARKEETSRNAMEYQREQMEIARSYTQSYFALTLDGVDSLVNGGLDGFKRFTAGILRTLAIEAAGRAAMEFAAGWAASASILGAPFAAAHFKAGALYAGAAVLMGGASVALNASAGSGGGGSSVSQSANDRGGVASESRGRKQKEVTIIIQAGVLTGADAGREIQAAIDANSRTAIGAAPRKDVVF